MGESKKHYEVGYRKPPVHTRFKAGNRANPRGRPKGSKSWLPVIEKVLDELLPLADGKTKIEARLAMGIVARSKALKGDFRPFVWLYKMEQARLAIPSAQAPERLSFTLKLEEDGATDPWTSGEHPD